MKCAVFSTLGQCSISSLWSDGLHFISIFRNILLVNTFLVHFHILLFFPLHFLSFHDFFFFDIIFLLFVHFMHTLSEFRFDVSYPHPVLFHCLFTYGFHKL